MENIYRPTVIEVDLNAIKSNIMSLKGKLPSKTQIIAVVKANAYGHGDIQVARAALEVGATILAVATPEEAIRLRENGIHSEILILGATPPSFFQLASDLDITLTAYSVEWVFATKNIKKPLKVHVKIDSGMGRIGFTDIGELKEAIKFINENPWVEITGAYTHFATADEEHTEYYMRQVKKFNNLLSVFKEKPKVVHTSNSAAALRYPDESRDAVRYGISMYGIAPSPWLSEHLPFPLKKALSLYSEVTHVKKVKQGTSIGYGATYTAQKDEWIATLPIGYADGLLRNLQSQEVLVKGKRVPIVGRICMDQCMVRLNEPVEVGEKVVLLGMQKEEEIKIEEWANKLQTIPYEICCTLSARIPRLYSEQNIDKP